MAAFSVVPIQNAFSICLTNSVWLVKWGGNRKEKKKKKNHLKKTFSHTFHCRNKVRFIEQVAFDLIKGDQTAAGTFKQISCEVRKFKSRKIAQNQWIMNRLHHFLFGKEKKEKKSFFFRVMKRIFSIESGFRVRTSSKDQKRLRNESSRMWTLIDFDTIAAAAAAVVAACNNFCGQSILMCSSPHLKVLLHENYVCSFCIALNRKKKMN